MARVLSADSVRRRLRWWHFGVPAAAALLLGYLGFRSCLGPPGDLRGFLDLLYLSFQLFVFESGMDCGPGAPWTLQAARLLAPVAPVSAVVYALLLALREQVRLGRLLAIRNHAVVLGLGRKGSQLVRDFRHSGVPVVAIELDGASDHVSYCLNLGAVVLVGSAGDAALLRRAAVQRARIVVAVSGNDGVNVDSMLKIHRIIGESPRRRSRKVSGYVHLVDFNLCSLFKSHEVFADCTDRFEVRVFNVHTATVRLLYDRHPLDRGLITAHSPLIPHLVCIGLGTTGEAAVVQAARLGHVANGRRLRVTVVDLRAAERQRVFHGRNGWVRRVCDLAFIEGDIADEQVLESLRERVDTPDALPSLVVSMDDDSLNLKTALHLHDFFDRPDLSICVRMMEVDGLTSLLALRDGTGAAPIHPFGMGGLVCTRQMLEDPQQMRLARALHEAARSGRTPLREPGDEQTWERLSELRRDAFLVQVDHLPVMLRSVGCALAALPAADRPAAGDGGPFTAAEIETLACMEYRRRQTDRLIACHRQDACEPAGSPGPGAGSWQDLAAEAQRPYLAHVAALPAVLAQAGSGVVRLAPRS